MDYEGGSTAKGGRAFTPFARQIVRLAAWPL